VLIHTIVRFRRSRSSETAEPPQVYGSKPIEIAWTVAPALIVLIIVLVTTRTLWEVNVTPPVEKPGDNSLFVTVVGRQWWWEYRYDYYNGRPLGFITANELHIPASEDGAPRPVFLTLKSADVYHSFWVPRLAGKTALIPGRTNSMWFETGHLGLFLGQCAEFCGTQHAWMRLIVVAEPDMNFSAWLKRQTEPAGRTTVEGARPFQEKGCASCHAISGTEAAGRSGPDLTHVASRQILGSGISRNTAPNLAQWIGDPQSAKPGNHMPGVALSSAEAQALLAYLETLE
jgi:cytochrome c oxidase subunit 2